MQVRTKCSQLRGGALGLQPQFKDPKHRKPTRAAIATTAAAAGACLVKFKTKSLKVKEHKKAFDLICSMTHMSCFILISVIQPKLTVAGSSQSCVSRIGGYFETKGWKETLEKSVSNSCCLSGV